MQLDLTQLTKDYNDWDGLLKAAATATITVNLKREDVAQSGSANTGAAAQWITVIGVTPGVATSIAPADLKAYLAGGIKLSYTDDLSAYPIPEDSKISFLYKADVSITVKTTTGKTITVNCTPNEGTQLDFYRKSQIDPNVNGQYTSRPSYWSEIKEGTPNKESFEAMAGTPTTHDLYFASGGSEYIVDIVTEYVKDATAARTYTSKFNAVKSGLWIDGDNVTQNDSPPSCVARTSTDISGATFTESATMTQGTYVKEPASGTPGEPDYKAAVTGPSYTCTRSGGHNSMVGGYSKSWTQTVTFDYTKIKKVAVWKLVRSKVNGLATLIGTDEVTATIKQGEPTIFYNIASTNDSAGGRLRYSLETAQGDHVVWNEGDSDNRDANSSSDSYVNEDKVFEERAKSKVVATAVSDFLILQTSSGDQSVMYFEKSAPEVTVETTQIDIPKTSKIEQWDNNSLSAANWSQDAIYIGSYNG
ncbi:hypothetical protein [Cohnella fermenti]|uniref:Uncharacterized protein n=1 Tax=Cohnella fermenti TaxID=2565925 RepID=A0A4V3WDX1_9BACL|nr:hypothetical protein [Cohnella fermenti]THF73940.1 hypothetical protein E6C55_27105 [Cohnella fermenti]